jgi:hypothetical protein
VAAKGLVLNTGPYSKIPSKGREDILNNFEAYIHKNHIKLLHLVKNSNHSYDEKQIFSVDLVKEHILGFLGEENNRKYSISSEIIDNIKNDIFLKLTSCFDSPVKKEVSTNNLITEFFNDMIASSELWTSCKDQKDHYYDDKENPNSGLSGDLLIEVI